MNRRDELNQLQACIKDVDNEITMLFQSLQWDRNKLLSENLKKKCSYNAHHRLPHYKQTLHEDKCLLKVNGYSKDDILLPEPLNPNCNTLVKFDSDDIQRIIHNASLNDPSFKKGRERGSDGVQPMTVERLQGTYTADERRAIHDAVVRAAPACHDLSDLALADGSQVKVEGKTKSRVEILAELRDMKRRRTKYRVATKSKNFSDVLRDVIKTQMEFYNETQTAEKTRSNQKIHNNNSDRNFSNEILRNIKIERSSSAETDGKSIERFKAKDDRHSNSRYNDNSYDKDGRRHDDQYRKHGRREYDRRERDKTFEISKERTHKNYDRSNSPRRTERRDRDSYRHGQKASRHDDKRSKERHKHEYKRYEESSNRSRGQVKIKREPDDSGYSDRWGEKRSREF